MPKINRDIIRRWLEERDWSVTRLTAEFNRISEDKIPEGTMRNVVNGIDPMRPGRIRTLCRVTANHGDGLSYEQLVDPDW